METGKIYAVLTGDLIGSSRFRIQQREEVLSSLKESFQEISSDIIASPFVVFRGDSFQGVLARPDEALKATLIIRASLLSRFKWESSLEKGARVFGRNTYPTDAWQQFFLTVGRDIESDGDIDMRQMPGGLYAVLRFKNLDNIGNAWGYLWNWIRENKYEYIGMQKGDHGWCNGFEKQVNWL